MSELKALSEEVDKIKAIRSINISKAQKKQKVFSPANQFNHV